MQNVWKGPWSIWHIAFMFAVQTYDTLRIIWPYVEGWTFPMRTFKILVSKRLFYVYISMFQFFLYKIFDVGSWHELVCCVWLCYFHYKCCIYVDQLDKESKIKYWEKWHNTEFSCSAIPYIWTEYGKA